MAWDSSPQNSLLLNQCLYNQSSCYSTHWRIAAAAKLLQSWYFASWLCVRIPEVSQWARSDHVGNHEYNWAAQLQVQPQCHSWAWFSLWGCWVIFSSLYLDQILCPITQNSWNEPWRAQHNSILGVNKDQCLSVWAKTCVCCIHNGKSRLFSSLGRAEQRSFPLWAL